MSSNKINIEAVNARAREEQTPMTKIPSVEEVVDNFGKQFDALKMKPSKKSMPGLERELLKDFMRKALTAQRAAGSKDTGVAEERRKHCCCVIKDSQVIESCKMHADIAAAGAKKAIETFIENVDPEEYEWDRGDEYIKTLTPIEMTQQTPSYHARVDALKMKEREISLDDGSGLWERGYNACTHDIKPVVDEIVAATAMRVRDEEAVEYNRIIDEIKANIPVSFLRLWINEDRKQPHQELVTNEDIMRFINIGYGK